MSKPLAYFLSWTTYGTWLPGDERGWVKDGEWGIRPPEPDLEELAKGAMSQDRVILGAVERRVVRQTIERHCEIRKWKLFALNVRTNHVHVVLAADRTPEEVMSQLKAWCSRKLSENLGLKPGSGKKWWTEHGSTKWINDEQYLQNAIEYVLEGQGDPLP